jgi:hypothetical protein
MAGYEKQRKDAEKALGNLRGLFCGVSHDTIATTEERRRAKSVMSKLDSVITLLNDILDEYEKSF